MRNNGGEPEEALHIGMKCSKAWNKFGAWPAMLNFGTMNLTAKVKLKMKLHVDCEFLFMNNINKNWLRLKTNAMANETNGKKMTRSVSQNEMEKKCKEIQSQKTEQRILWNEYENGTWNNKGWNRWRFLRFFFFSLHSIRNEI